MGKLTKATVTGTKAGDRIKADDGFTCIESGSVLTVHEDDGLLFVFCQDEDGEPQRHYLAGQIECGCYVGFKKFAALARAQETRS